MSENTDATAPTAEAVLDIDGMTCASCVARVEKRLGRVEGVEAAVNLATETARVRYPAGLDTAALIDAVRAAGYDATVRTRAGRLPATGTPASPPPVASATESGISDAGTRSPHPVAVPAPGGAIDVVASDHSGAHDTATGHHADVHAAAGQPAEAHHEG
ncbi:heavy metal-associated domain-containing protein, partial [uncultured Microbacterium sp.]|uniref:heavy-metal-associated domain-containing protein n=1 Tax=uncultured Microbacterium sp. TaxID=191216 RepID=UPI0028D3C07B